VAHAADLVSENTLDEAPAAERAELLKALQDSYNAYYTQYDEAH
jgi:hypothetical protein